MQTQPDPAESAEAAGLRHVSDMMPGIRRGKTGTSFSYAGPDGKIIKDQATLNPANPSAALDSDEAAVARLLQHRLTSLPPPRQASGSAVSKRASSGVSPPCVP